MLLLQTTRKAMLRFMLMYGKALGVMLRGLLLVYCASVSRAQRDCDEFGKCFKCAADADEVGFCKGAHGCADKLTKIMLTTLG